MAEISTLDKQTNKQTEITGFISIDYDLTYNLKLIVHVKISSLKL